MNRTWVFLAVLGCSVPRGALPGLDPSDGGVDAARDATMDTAIDVPGVDAPGVDAPGVDAPGVDAPGVDATMDVGIDAPGPDAGCGALGSRTCDGNTLRVCEAGGLSDVRMCLRGCGADVCNAYDVLNVDEDRLLHVGEISLVVAGGEDVIFFTETGEVVLEPGGIELRPAGVGIMNGISYEREAQSGGAPGLGIFSLDNLDVQSGGFLTGEGSDALVILVGGEVMIAGEVDVSASSRFAGVGGFNAGTRDNDGENEVAGGGAGERRDFELSGGGGGGHAANGGRGGDNGDANGGEGGEVLDDSTGTPLMGGGGGGGNATIGGSGRSGGGGGGAIQISAGTAIVVSGVVRAAGAGGRAGWSSGGGGGAGGSIVLQAPRLDISGVVQSNGGGGGGGQPAVIEDAQPGEDGLDERGRANGGNGPGGGRNGGDGGSAENLTGQDGQDGGPAGGGGGAAGRVSFYAEGGAPSVSGVVSPDPTNGDIP